MKKILCLCLSVLVLSSSVKAEPFDVEPRPPLTQDQVMERSGNLILAGTILLAGGLIAGRNAKIVRRQGGAKANDQDKYAGAKAIGMFSGILCLAVGISIRF